jgi:6-phosphofructokinase
MPTENRYRAADGFFSKQADVELVEREIQRVLSDEFEIIPKRRIAVLTSGGDAPGMNAAIWSIVRTAMNCGVEVMGVQDGYLGLVEDKMRKLKWEEVSDIIEKSGTILGTARFPKFAEQSVRKKAVNNIKRRHISSLIVIGGDGSMMGAHALAKDLKKNRVRFRTVGIPGTIDNDLWGTDMSLGAASAANAMIVEMRNMIQPARALRRIFVCEVMGASCGYLALQSALGVGADAVITPEQVIEVLTGTTQSNGLGWKDCIDVNKTEECYRKEFENDCGQIRGWVCCQQEIRLHRSG